MVVTFGPDGAYGHPDHVAISAATTQAFTLAGAPRRLFHSHFPKSRLLMLDRLARIHPPVELEDSLLGLPPR